MRRQQQRRAARAQGYGLARTISIPTAVNGLMGRSHTAEYSNLYAAELLNWRSTGASLRVRSSHSLSPTGDTASQRIAFEYGAAQEYLTVTDTEVRARAASASRRFNKPLDAAYISSHVILTDGRSAPLLYNGQQFSNGAFTTSTDIAQDQFDGVIAHQDRLFFWKSGDDLDFYYGDVGAIMGPLERFPLGRLGNITGQIVCLKSLTIDAGHGMNDTLAIFTSTGQIIAYEGLDPGDPRDWRQLARITVSPPISKRALVPVGGDLWMLTAAGVVSVIQTLQNGSLALVGSISELIQERLTDRIAEGGEWSMHLSADAASLIINRVYDGSASQFIFRTDTKSWMETDYPARMWHNLGQLTQFTTLDGELATLDDKGEEPITARWVSSWFRLPKAGGITYLKPTIIGTGPLTVKVTILSDHDTTGVDIAEAVQEVTVLPDNPADPGGRVSLNEIIAVDAVGEVFQLRMEVTAREAEIVNVQAGIL